MTEYSASTENLIEAGPLEIVPSSQNLYMSLLPTVSSTQTSLAPYTPQTSSNYLHAQPSTVALSHKHKHRKGKRTHRKDSSSSESRQTEIVKHNFKKLQICFVLLCVLNIIMLTVYVVTYPKFGPLFSDSSDDFTETGDGQLKTFKLCTKCQPLQAKVGFADGLIESIRSAKYPDFCCFRRIDQILRLFDGYAEKYVDQEVFKVRQEMKYNLTRHVGAVTPKQSLALAHLYYIIPDHVVGQDASPLTWETKGIDILLVGRMKVLRQQHLEIPDSGYYYVYSHLQLKSGSQTTHVVMKNVDIATNKKKLLSQKNSPQNTALVSELQGVFRLEKGDTLTVLATQIGIQSGERGNYFGAYMLQQ